MFGQRRHRLRSNHTFSRSVKTVFILNEGWQLLLQIVAHLKRTRHLLWQYLVPGIIVGLDFVFLRTEHKIVLSFHHRSFLVLFFLGSEALTHQILHRRDHVGNDFSRLDAEILLL